MEQTELINICDRRGSYNACWEAPNGEAWFICRRCGCTQFVAEEVDNKHSR